MKKNQARSFCWPPGPMEVDQLKEPIVSFLNQWPANGQSRAMRAGKEEETMIEEKPEDPAETKADPLIDYLTGRGPLPWERRRKRKRKRRRKRKRTLGDQSDMFRKRYTSERATEPEAPAPEKTKETP